MRYGAQVKQLENLLSPFRLQKEIGTGTIGNYRKGSKVLYYSLVKESKKVLLSVNNIFEWQSPQRYEDIIFYIRGVYWLRTITHEKYMFVNPRFKEHNQWLINTLNAEIE